jgi:hypothetical protein
MLIESEEGDDGVAGRRLERESDASRSSLVGVSNSPWTMRRSRGKAMSGATSEPPAARL